MKTNGEEPINPTAYWSERISEKGGLVQGEGLTKREYFAAMAMQGALSSITGGDWASAINVAKRSVEYADALIEELNK